MDLKILNVPINLNIYGRKNVLKDVFSRNSFIIDGLAKNVPNGGDMPISVEKVSDTVRIFRVSTENGKGATLPHMFDSYVKSCQNFKSFDTTPVQDNLEALRNPKGFFEFIIEKVGKKNSKFKIKDANFVIQNRAKEIQDVSKMSEDEIVQVYTHNQASTKETKLNTSDTKMLFKNIIEQFKREQKL